MISREQAARTALYELEQQREQNFDAGFERERQAIAACPELGEMLQRRRKLFDQGIRDAFRNPQESQAVSDRLQMELTRLHGHMRRLLRENGFPEDYLQPIVRCPICRDTGYVGEPVHELCTCVQQRIMKIMMSDAGLQDLERENFSTYDAAVFPNTQIPGKKNTQRSYMEKVRQRLEQYADGFRPRQGKGVVLIGAAGLGKTFLMNCVAERVLTRGFSVLKMTAYRLYDTMRSYQYDQSEADLVDDLIRVDLLAIDDLGTEPATRGSNEVSGLYHILNERISLSGAIILTTNLSVTQIRERYGERIGSRLCDLNRMSVYELFGEDVRLLGRG